MVGQKYQPASKRTTNEGRSRLLINIFGKVRFLLPFSFLGSSDVVEGRRAQGRFQRLDRTNLFIQTLKSHSDTFRSGFFQRCLNYVGN